ncbi:hypothetical protein IWW35_003353 [Coemansia sp. RSA 1878]|nr:hypothetical protein IWW35_003353 [Coemansia sp. RSA 1878]
MLKAICDESLAGDTLMVAMGAKPERLTFYDDLTVHVTSYIANGTVKKYGSLLSSLFSRILDSTLGFIRKKLPYEDS